MGVIMIKKFIPERFNLDSVNIFEIITNVVGNVPITLNGRMIIIDAELTAQQKLQIRDDFLNNVEIVEDISI
jgi:hypothetical protein